MLEMDRILRPGGQAYIRDTVSVMKELQPIAKAMGWGTDLRETGEGPHASYRILRCDKHWRDVDGNGQNAPSNGEVFFAE